jgi:hypothetical protein
LQTFAFLVGSYLSLSVLSILAGCFSMPPIFVGYQILWLVILILPLLGGTFVFSPHQSPDVMKMMPVKNREHLTEMSRYMWYFVWRFTPVIAMTFIVYAL